MRQIRTAPLAVHSLLCAFPLLIASPAHADWNVQISVGPPRNPYVTDPGMGNYPGGHGAIVPGYGYWPDYSEHWPTLREALQAMREGRVPGSAPLEAPVVVPVVPSGTCALRVHVPAEAALWFEGSPTTQQGTWRQFVTPLFSGNGTFTYEVRARWNVEGQPVERVETVRVRPGDNVTVDFLAPPPPEKLPLPRQAGVP